MANSAQASKRIRQTEKRTERNKMLRTRMRSEVKRFETLLESDTPSKEAVGKGFTAVMSELHKAVGNGILKKNTASRKISRLATRVRTLTAGK
ncbi:MAG: 30S ribosomal protein S20 [Alphaproteobacteria bacterium]|jgi:small subunit ribosomal protein S20|nr:30S ribosomal protein S20 [Alphaproteobacteria bacterium]